MYSTYVHVKVRGFVGMTTSVMYMSRKGVVGMTRVLGTCQGQMFVSNLVEMLEVSCDNIIKTAIPMFTRLSSTCSVHFERPFSSNV